jgi:predicted aspartyl protease
LFFGSQLASATSCRVLGPHQPSDAEEAFLHGDYDHAIELYQQQLQKEPNSPELTAGLAEALLRQQKFADAQTLVEKALAQIPQSSVLMTSLGEVQYRAGKPWLAVSSAENAVKLDPCNPQARLLESRMLRLNSYYASAAGELATAHALDPTNPRIRSRWLETLPLKDRIAELEAYLASPNGEDPETLKSLRFHLAYLQQAALQPHKACRLVSQADTANIPFASLMQDATHIRAFGLTVKLNDHDARLQIDTGAGGLVLSRATADHAGLKQYSENEVSGIGSQGNRSAYTAFADDIKIGPLEFKDCAVEVLDKGHAIPGNGDGLIGMDVFSRFVVTLDYPERKLLLSPLPARPGDTNESKPTLETTGTANPEAPHDATDAGPAPKRVTRGPFDRYVAPEMENWTRVYRVGHNLLVPAVLNDSSPRLFVIDTGSFSTLVDPEVAREVTKVRNQSAVTVRGINGKVDKVYSADDITFKFANMSQRVPNAVSISTAGMSKNMGTEVGGLIGITALGQLTISIDYRDGLVKFVYEANRGYR